MFRQSLAVCWFVAQGALASGGAMSAAAKVAAADFLPAVAGGSTTVQAPDEVKVNEQTSSLEAANAQDAINAAVARNRQRLPAEGGLAAVPGTGATLVRFPSGLGVVATGVGSYPIGGNPVATRISQRKAALLAFSEAKKHLAAYLHGLSHEGKEEIRQSLANLETRDESLTNLELRSESTLRQSVDALLQGFVVYEILDDPQQQLVYLSIVTTPKTRGQLARSAPDFLEADSLEEGLTAVLTELKLGLVPPLGGRIVTVPATGETAFVGYGSAVVRSHGLPALQAKLNLEAQKVAAARAQDSLCGLILGDQTSWRGEVHASSRTAHREFEEILRDDPLPPTPQALQRREQLLEEFAASLRTTDVFANARRGVLPPGVTLRTWFDEDHTWAYGAAVYLPRVTRAAVETRREVDAATIVPRNRAGFEDYRTESGRPHAPEGIGQPAERVAPLPSGRIKDEEL